MDKLRVLMPFFIDDWKNTKKNLIGQSHCHTNNISVQKMPNKRLSCQELYNPGKASPIGGFGNFTFKKRRGGFDDKSTGFTVCKEDVDIVTTARTRVQKRRPCIRNNWTPQNSI
jgi:hypothetical protein